MGGDWTAPKLPGGCSSFGPPDSPRRYFADENTIGRHSAPGVITMANSGVHSNTSLFFVTLAPARHLDGRNVAFGRVLAGLPGLDKLAGVPTANNAPVTPVVVVGCGVLDKAGWAAVDALAASEAAVAAAAAAAPRKK